MSEFIPLSVPSFNGNEWKYVKDCIETEWVSSAGKYVEIFEANIAKYTNSKYAVACVNGTAALHISLIIAGIKPNDEIIVPTITFIATINVVRYLNAFPIFMDADEYYNIDSIKVKEFIEKETYYKEGYTYNRLTGRKIGAILPVHVFGNAIDYEELLLLCKNRNIKIIEDATESLGTKYISGNYKGKYTGTIGDIGCLSFNGNKLITTGGGGMILTDNEEYAIKAKYLTTQAKNDENKYIHNEIGYNYRLSNIQAALGVAQLENIDHYISIKKENYMYYKNNIDKITGLKIAEVPTYADNNMWMYALQIDEEKYCKDKEYIMNKLRKNNIQSRPVWYLNHLQKPFINYYKYKIEKAYKLFDTTINIPCSINLIKDNLDKIIEILYER